MAGRSLVPGPTSPGQQPERALADVPGAMDMSTYQEFVRYAWANADRLLNVFNGDPLLRRIDEDAKRMHETWMQTVFDQGVARGRVIMAEPPAWLNVTDAIVARSRELFQPTVEPEPERLLQFIQVMASFLGALIFFYLFLDARRLAPMRRGPVVEDVTASPLEGRFGAAARGAHVQFSSRLVKLALRVALMESMCLY